VCEGKIVSGLEIMVRYRCKVCGGTGIVRNPLWQEWDESIGREVPSGPEADWNGFEVRNKAWWSSRGCQKEPPEEVECEECSKGWVIRWVPISDVMRKAF